MNNLQYFVHARAAPIWKGHVGVAPFFYLTIDAVPPYGGILTYKTEVEAIRLANDSVFGLMAYVSSSNPERASRVAR